MHMDILKPFWVHQAASLPRVLDYDFSDFCNDGRTKKMEHEVRFILEHAVLVSTLRVWLEYNLLFKNIGL